MAKNSTGKNGTGQSGRGGPQSRKPVTLDLPSEEVARKEAESAAASASSDKAASTDKPAASGKASAESAAKPSGEAAASGGKPDTAQAASAKSEGHTAAKPTAAPKSNEGGKPVEPQTPSAFASASDSEKAPSAAPAPAPRSVPFASLVAAALVGGAVVVVVVVVLALNGFFRPPAVEAPDYSGEIATLKQDVDALKATVAENDLAPLRSDITALQQSVSALENAPAPEAPDDSALKALQDRVAQLEQRVSQIASGSGAAGEGTGSAAPDLSGVESAIDDLKQQLASLSTKVDGLPGSDRVQSIEASVQSIEENVQSTQTRIQSMETELSKVSGEMETAHALAPAVAADALAAAIESGRPFASELTSLESLGVDPDKLATLKPDAETGLPTLAAIRARFEAEIEGIDLATQLLEGTGAIDRLLQSARGLVDVRPAQPTVGTDPAAIVTRIRAALAAGDLKTALSEWNTLPDDIKNETADWAKLAEARAAADDLVAELRASALSKLGSDG